MQIDISKLSSILNVVKNDMDEEGYEILQDKLLQARDDADRDGFSIVSDVISQLVMVLETARDK